MYIKITESNFYSPVNIWATSWQNLLLPYANNKSADQLVVCCLDSIIPLFAIAEISRPYLFSVAESYMVANPWDRFSRANNVVLQTPHWWESPLRWMPYLYFVTFWQLCHTAIRYSRETDKVDIWAAIWQNQQNDWADLSLRWAHSFCWFCHVVAHLMIIKG